MLHISHQLLKMIVSHLITISTAASTQTLKMTVTLNLTMIRSRNKLGLNMKMQLPLIPSDHKPLTKPSFLLGLPPKRLLKTKVADKLSESVGKMTQKQNHNKAYLGQFHQTLKSIQ